MDWEPRDREFLLILRTDQHEKMVRLLPSVFREKGTVASLLIELHKNTVFSYENS